MSQYIKAIAAFIASLVTGIGVAVAYVNEAAPQVSAGLVALAAALNGLAVAFAPKNADPAQEG